MDTFQAVLEKLRDEGFSWIRTGSEDRLVDEVIAEMSDPGPEVAYDTHEDGTARLFRVNEEGTRGEDVYAILFTESAHRKDTEEGEDYGEG